MIQPHVTQFFLSQVPVCEVVLLLDTLETVVELLAEPVSLSLLEDADPLSSLESLEPVKVI